MVDQKIMGLEAQRLRTRVLHLEYAIGRFFTDGDVERLRRAYSNEWVQPIGKNSE